MKNLKNKISYVVMDKQFGMVYDIAVDACELSKEIGMNVMFEFNDVEVYVRPTSDPKEVSERALDVVSSGGSFCYNF